MSRSISAAQANREFSALLRRVREGQSFVVTSHGHPVARIVPATSADSVARSARAALFERLSTAKARSIGRWTRDDLYVRDSR